jgi:hypothetical protein
LQGLHMTPHAESGAAAKSLGPSTDAWDNKVWWVGVAFIG